MPEFDERMEQINTLDCGTNRGAMQIMSKRVEENVARAMLVDLHREGLITVWKDRWDEANRLIGAIRRVTKRDE